MGGYEYGDVNGDGRIDVTDASLILQHIAKLITLTPEQIARADVAYNNSIDVTDATLILMYIAKFDVKFGVQ